MNPKAAKLFWLLRLVVGLAGVVTATLILIESYFFEFLLFGSDSSAQTLSQAQSYFLVLTTAVIVVAGTIALMGLLIRLEKFIYHGGKDEYKQFEDLK